MLNLLLCVGMMLSVGGVAAAQEAPRVGANVPVTLQDLANRTANNSPVLVADPGEPRFVALANRLDGPDFGCTLQVSGDGGRNWLTVNPVPTLPPGAEKCYAPEVAFDRRGHLHYLFLGLHGGGNAPMGAFLTTSADHGASFTPPVQVLGPERYQVRMAIDRTLGRVGRMHLVWLETTVSPPLGGLPPPPNPLMAAYSDDGGRSFSSPVTISDPDRPRAVAPAVALGPDHAVHVLYYDLRDDVIDYQGLEGNTWEGNWSLVVTTSTDGGRRFGRGVAVDDGLVPPERVMLIYTMPPPSLVADPSGNLYAAWYDARNGDWDVFLRRSSDGGRSWSSPRRLNDDPLGNGRHQYLPRLAVAPSGRIDAIFYDRRGNAENRGNDVYYTYSSNGGARFATNLKLTSIDSDSKIGPRYDVPSAAGLNEFGARIALWSDRSTVLAAWTDTRNTGRAFPAQDIFATTVRFPDEPGRSPWVTAGVALAAGLLGAAVVLVLWRWRRGKGDRLSGAAAVTLLAFLAVTCGPRSAAPLPPGRPSVTVTMREFEFSHGVIPKGQVVFRVRNVGQEPHRLSLIPLPAELPPINEQLQGRERAVVNTQAAIPDLPPGGVGTFATELVAGRYAFVCFTPDPDGSTHAVKGMATEFRIE